MMAFLTRCLALVSGTPPPICPLPLRIIHRWRREPGQCWQDVDICCGVFRVGGARGRQVDLTDHQALRCS